jgi:uncharacterized RDD family membrane protein YckC
MVSAARQVSSAANADSDATAPAVATRIAHLNARVSAYLIDTVVLVAFLMVSFVIAGGQLLLASDMGEGDPPDASFAAFAAILSFGVILSWTAFNVGLTAWRGQSAGKYVVGIKVTGEDGERAPAGRLLVRWFGLHPLLFHPLLMVPWAILFFLGFSQAPGVVSMAVYILAGALLALCVLAPVVALLYTLFDGERRSLHDRLARTVVVHMDQP